MPRPGNRSDTSTPAALAGDGGEGADAEAAAATIEPAAAAVDEGEDAGRAAWLESVKTGLAQQLQTQLTEHLQAAQVQQAVLFQHMLTQQNQEVAAALQRHSEAPAALQQPPPAPPHAAREGASIEADSVLQQQTPPVVADRIQPPPALASLLDGGSLPPPPKLGLASPRSATSSKASLADTDKAADIESTLALAIGIEDQTLRHNPHVSSLSTELWRITSELQKEKKLDTGELNQFNTIVGAARCLLRLRASYAFDDDNDEGMRDVLERCRRDIARIHVRADPLLKTKEQAEQVFLAACAKRDSGLGDNAIAGVSVCMPEIAEILTKMRRDHAERPKIFDRPVRKDDDDDKQGGAKQAKDAAKQAKDAADALRARDKKIGELAKALRDNNITMPPRKTAGAATKTKDKSKDKDDGAAGP